jgi:predicted DNA-binding transcriptional regulator YafY
MARLMARNEQLIRQHKILQILERRRFGSTLEDIRDSVVQELGLSTLHTRSIRRDIEALQAAGMDIGTEDTQLGKVWKLRRVDKGLHKISVTATELISLSMGRDLMMPLVGTSFWQGIEGFWNKIREQLPSGVWEHYQRYRRTLRVMGLTRKNYEKQQGILKTVNRAVEEHRVLECEYESLGKPLSVRRLEPYGIAIYRSSIYVVAVESDKKSDEETEERLRHWKLDRFTKATALDKWFKPDDSIDLERHLGKSVGIFSGDKPAAYRIRLSALASKWIQEEPWHAEQSVEFQNDGSSILTVPAYHPMEIIPQILSYGADAELLEPKQGREAIRKMIKELAANYRIDAMR